MDETFESVDVEDIGYLDPSDAQKLIDKTMDSMDEQHPYCDNQHVGHRRAKEKMSALFKAAAVDRESEGDRLLREALEEKAEREEKQRESVRKQAEEELAQLVKLGFDDDDMPDVVYDYHLRGLRGQRLHAQAERGSSEAWAEFKKIIKEDLGDLRDVDIATRQSLQMLMSTPFSQGGDNRLLLRIADTLLQYIFTAKKENQNLAVPLSRKLRQKQLWMSFKSIWEASGTFAETEKNRTFSL
jgi:hypothetical protein